MKEFEVGDIVIRTEASYNTSLSDITNVLALGQRCKVTYSHSSDICVGEGDTPYWAGNFKLAPTQYSDPPLSHWRLRVEYAKGAKIEYFSASLSGWLPTAYPNWGKDTRYRVRPEPTVYQLKIAALEKAIEDFRNEVEELKGVDNVQRKSTAPL